MAMTSLFASATAAATPSFPGAVADETWRWAIQTGGFGALFAVLVWVALKWLASRMDNLDRSRTEAQQQERETLLGVVKTSNEVIARLLPILEKMEDRRNQR